MSSTGEIKVGLNGRGGGGENPSPQLKHEDYPTTVSGDCGGGGRSLNFNDEQIDCICDSLQQRGDVSKLENFLQIHEADKPITAIGKGSETVMRARAFVAFERGRYRELYNIIETREFNPKYHPQLQDMWYRAHYKEAEGVRGRALGKIVILVIYTAHTPKSIDAFFTLNFLNVLSVSSQFLIVTGSKPSHSIRSVKLVRRFLSNSTYIRLILIWMKLYILSRNFFGLFLIDIFLVEQKSTEQAFFRR